MDMLVPLWISKQTNIDIMIPNPHNPRLCNFQKDGPGAIKLPAPEASSTDHCRASDTTAMSSVSSDQGTESELHHPPKSAEHRKSSHYTKLSTLLNVLTFSSVMKKRKKDRDKNMDDSYANVSTTYSYSYTDWILFLNNVLFWYLFFRRSTHKNTKNLEGRCSEFSSEHLIHNLVKLICNELIFILFIFFLTPTLLLFYDSMER